MQQYGMPKTGRPNGRLIHAEGLEALLAARGLLKRDLCSEATISPGLLSDLLAHRAGASPSTIEKLTGALAVKPEALFPEIVGWIGPIPDRDAKRGAA